MPWIIGGDLDWFGAQLKLPFHGSNRPCWLCPASRVDTTMLVTDVSPTAAWRDLLRVDTFILYKHPQHYCDTFILNQHPQHYCGTFSLNQHPQHYCGTVILQSTSID